MLVRDVLQVNIERDEVGLFAWPVDQILMKVDTVEESHISIFGLHVRAQIINRFARDPVPQPLIQPVIGYPTDYFSIQNLVSIAQQAAQEIGDRSKASSSSIRSGICSRTFRPGRGLTPRNSGAFSKPSCDRNTSLESTLSASTPVRIASVSSRGTTGPSWQNPFTSKSVSNEALKSEASGRSHASQKKTALAANCRAIAP